MEALEKKLNDIKEQLEKALNILPSPKAPQAPTTPNMTPSTKKNPVKVAQQLKDPSSKKIAVKQAKEVVKVGQGGQWKLDKVFPVPGSP